MLSDQRYCQVLFATSLLCLVATLFCAWRLGLQDQNRLDTSASESQVPINERFASEVPVVLRIERLTEGDGFKYYWPTVKILGVLKNDTTENFVGTLQVAHRAGSAGIHAGRSTIYLVRYSESVPEHGWRLDESFDRSKTGVTHHVSSTIDLVGDQ